MALTADQLADMSADLGIGAHGAVFTDDELNRLYERAGESYPLAVYYGYRQLLADANKLFDYASGQTSVKHSQVRAHIKDQMELWRSEAAEAPGVGKTKLRYDIDFSYPTTPDEHEWKSRVDNAG